RGAIPVWAGPVWTCATSTAPSSPPAAASLTPTPATRPPAPRPNGTCHAPAADHGPQVGPPSAVPAPVSAHPSPVCSVPHRSPPSAAGRGLSPAGVAGSTNPLGRLHGFTGAATTRTSTGSPWRPQAADGHRDDVVGQLENPWTRVDEQSRGEPGPQPFGQPFQVAGVRR